MLVSEHPNGKVSPSQWHAAVAGLDWLLENIKHASSLSGHCQRFHAGDILLVGIVCDRLHDQRKVSTLGGRLCQATGGECLDVECPQARETDGNSVDDASGSSEKPLAECLHTPS